MTSEITTIDQDERVQELSSITHELVRQAQGLEIHDIESDRVAVEFILQVKTARKRWDELRHWFTDPLEAQKKAIIAKFKADDAPLAEAEVIASQKHLRWDREQREIARREEERLRKLAEQRAAKAAERAEAKGLEAPLVQIPRPTVQAPLKTVHTAAGSLTVRTAWDFRIVDFAALPEEYKVADTAMIGRVVRAGVRQIPGVEIFETESLGGRS